MAVLVRLTDEDNTPEELATCTLNLNDKAKAEARRGHTGIYGARYAELHANINVVMTDPDHPDFEWWVARANDPLGLD